VAEAAGEEKAVVSLEERSPATPEETEVPLEGAKAEQRVAGEAM
tara:strand:- start:32 stop:163 length:132 start_codon:yes stop_codon:yes gene_type:complete